MTPSSNTSGLDSCVAYCERFDEALIMAALAHAKKVRKGTAIPYIIHPVHVASILERHGFSPDVVIAGLLHDVLEDTPWNDTDIQRSFHRTFVDLPEPPREPEEFRQDVKQLIVQRFGNAVLDLVADVSEQKTESSGEAIPWRTRKQSQLSHLRRSRPDVVALKAADALHNLHATLRDLAAHGLAALSRFNATPDDKLWEASTTVTLIAERLGEEHSLVCELRRALDQYYRQVERCSGAPQVPEAR